MGKLSCAIRLAFTKGYRVIDGEVISPKGKKRKLQKTSTRGTVYYRFTIYNDGEIIPVDVHRLVAYQKFGEASLEPHNHNRHLDNDPSNNSEDNIVLGSPSQNALDRPEQDRREHASKGNQQLSEEVILALRADYASGLGYKKLRAKWGFGLSTLSYYLSEKAKRTSFSFPNKT